MRRKIFIGTVLASSLFVSGACTSNYLEYNTDPYGTTDGHLESDGYLVRSLLTGVTYGVVSPDVNTAQFTECLLGGEMGGYMAPANANWSTTTANYNPDDEWTQVFMQSDKIIPVIYTNYNKLYQTTDDPVILSVADIIKVASMHKITDAYGPIPYSKIGKDGKIQVEYDSQETVYKTMFDELNHAIDVLTPLRANDFAPSADVIYGGCTEKWIKFANSLKLRLAMRISYADPALSRQMAEQAVHHEVGTITANSENARFTTFGVDGNPLNVAVKYNMGDHTTGGDSHAAADIVCYMNGYKDPRRSVYFTESEWEGDEYKYVGLRRGIIIPDHESIGGRFSGVLLSPDDPVVWMNASEVAFLKAEAQAVFNYDMGGSAQSFYEEGVRLSFEQWGVSGADKYLDDGESVAENYVDPSGANTYNNGTLSKITVKWDESADVEVKQERILTQKWIANWLLGNEAWADWRRTGYPLLIPATEEGNKSNGIVDSEQGARRFKYPRSEYVNNAANIAVALDSYLDGPDEMSTKLWFDCKPVK